MNTKAAVSGSGVKGKQATRGEKQILEENRQTIDAYFKLFAASHLIYLAVRYLLFWDSFTSLYIGLFVMTSLFAAAGYYFLSYIGQPLRDERGVVQAAGSDLNMQGHVSEYAKDVIIFAAIVYTLTLVSNYFWLTLLVAPVYLFVLLWRNVLGPWFFAPGPEADADGDAQQNKKTKEKRRIIRR